MESSPPLRICGTRSVFSLWLQHLLALAGSHQHLASPPGQLEALRHFSTRCSCSGRLAGPKLMMAFMVPGFDTVSIGSAEVSTVPGRARAISCHSRTCGSIPEASICDTRLYWLPTSPSMFSHSGLLGTAGGFSGSYEM